MWVSGNAPGWVQCSVSLNVSRSPNSGEGIHSEFAFCFPPGSPLVTTYVHDQLSEVLLFSIVRTFYSRRAQAPAVNYIRKTFRAYLKTSCIPGCVPIWIELNNRAKRGSCMIYFGHAVGSHLNLNLF